MSQGVRNKHHPQKANNTQTSCLLSRKRSLCRAITDTSSVSEPPRKRAKTEQSPRSDGNIHITVGFSNATQSEQSFWIETELLRVHLPELVHLCNHSESQQNSSIYLQDIEPSIFHHIQSQLDRAQSILQSAVIIDVLHFAIKYEMQSLIQNIQRKLSEFQQNIPDWFRVTKSFEKYECMPSLQPFRIDFIAKHPFGASITDITLHSAFHQLSIDSLCKYLLYANCNKEDAKFQIIYKYVENMASKSAQSQSINVDDCHQTKTQFMRQMIKNQFLQLFEPHKLTLISAANTNHDNKPKDELLDLILESVQNTECNIVYLPQQMNQANPRKKQKPDKVETSNVQTNIPMKSVLLDTDKKLEKLFSKHGFSHCVKLHSTAQGSVWRATNNHSKHGDEHVVIKAAKCCYYQSTQIDEDEEDTKLGENIMNEVQILRDLNTRGNDGIIRLLNVIEEREYFMIVLEDGGLDLFHFTTECHRKLSSKHMKLTDWQQSVRRIFHRVACIVHWLHAQNALYHLDLSLENILISHVEWMRCDGGEMYVKLRENFKLKLIDFGAATLKTQRMHKGCIGKVSYCSPQIYRGERFDAEKADCWSFGVCLFTMLIGAPPWNKPDVEQNRLFQAIVLDRNMDKILAMWRRTQYMTQSMRSLLSKIFVINEADRVPMKAIKHELECE